MSTRGVFFGWWVALSFAVMAFLSSGIRFAVGPFLEPMVADLGLDRASFSLVVACGLLLFGALQPFVGRLVDRIGARPGSASMAGITLMVPVAMWGVLTIGWRQTHFALGLAVVALVVPMSLWLVRESPEAMGLTPDGLPPAAWAGDFLGLWLVRDQPVLRLFIAIAGGASMSGSLAAASALSAEIFGRLSVGSVSGTMFLFHQPGSALGSWLSGALFETTGGYGAGFGLASALLLGASLLSATIDERPRPVAPAGWARWLSGAPRPGEVSEGA